MCELDTSTGTYSAREGDYCETCGRKLYVRKIKKRFCYRCGDEMQEVQLACPRWYSLYRLHPMKYIIRQSK